MASVTLKGLAKRFGAVSAVDGVDLEIGTGEFVVFVGPSGCGKSTLLRLIAGLEDISEGELLFDGETMNARTPSERGVAMVFQSYALYPHMTVFENMAFGLKLAKTARETVKEKVVAAARTLELEDLLDRLPRQLSGGQRQRVAIGRAIVRDPRVFLFDEPLSNLDAALRVQTRIEIAALHKRMSDTTMIYVTHDQVEAMTLADRIVVLREGRVEQAGAPMELYRRPVNRFVAEFLGSPAMNIVAVEHSAAGLRAVGGHSDARLDHAPEGTARIGVRPETLTLAGECDPCLFEGSIRLIERLGEFQFVYLDPGAEPDAGASPLVVKLPIEAALERGATIRVAAATEALHYFDEDGWALRPDQPAPSG